MNTTAETTPVPWDVRIQEAFPHSDRNYWPNELILKYMTQELHELRSYTKNLHTTPDRLAEIIELREGLGDARHVLSEVCSEWSHLPFRGQRSHSAYVSVTKLFNKYGDLCRTAGIEQYHSSFYSGDFYDEQ